MIIKVVHIIMTYDISHMGILSLHCVPLHMCSLLHALSHQPFSLPASPSFYFGLTKNILKIRSYQQIPSNTEATMFIARTFSSIMIICVCGGSLLYFLWLLKKNFFFPGTYGLLEHMKISKQTEPLGHAQQNTIIMKHNFANTPLGFYIISFQVRFPEIENRNSKCFFPLFNDIYNMKQFHIIEKCFTRKLQLYAYMILYQL